MTDSPTANTVVLLGEVSSDPESRQTGTGRRVANFRVKTEREWTDRSTGEITKRSQYHRIVAWGRRAEFAEELTRGQRVLVTGELQTRKWQDRDGQDRWVTEVNAEEIHDGTEIASVTVQVDQQAGRAAPSTPPPRRAQAAPQAAAQGDAFNDDIPF